MRQRQYNSNMQTINTNTPLQLIRFRDNRFQIPPQAKQFLANFKNPLAVVTIVGKYRTGKSLFLNKVLLRNSIFKVSPTINSCTKGLWMCQQTIKADNNEETDVLVIDTEGFGATEQTDAYNNKILLFAMLLSSYFIYNSVGSIDENSLNNLNVIANLAKQIQKTNSKDDKIDEEFPSFLWLVRDFTLNLVDKSGFSIQAKEYLQQALEIQKGTSDAIQNKNKIRRMIKHFFKDRDCFTMIRPVETEEQLQNLESLKNSEFRNEFIEQVTLLRNKILKKVKSKKIKGRALDGQMLLELVSTYVDAINHGSLPNFEMSYKHLVKYQLNKSIHKFATTCRTQLQENALKMHSKEQILQLEERLVHDLAGKFKDNGSDQEEKAMVDKLKKEVKEMVTAFQKDNQSKILRNCQDIWGGLYDEYRQFANSGEIQHYFSELSRQFDQEILASGNPISHQYYNNIILSQKTQTLGSYMRTYHEQTHLDLQDKANHITRLQQQCAAHKCQNQALEEQLSQLKREHLLLGGKYTEFQKIKQMEIGYLTQKERENNQEICRLMRKGEEFTKDLENYRKDNFQIQGKAEDLSRSLRQLSEQKRLLDKELDILKNTLASKNNENNELKHELSETAIRLETALEKQVTILTKNQMEMDCKSKEYLSLKLTNEDKQTQIAELDRNILKLQHDLDSTKLLSQRERNIYENMFQNFKESLKSESMSREGLIETNKNLSSALKHMEKRAEQAEQKQKQLKQYKKCVKNASCLQCQHCTKFFVPSIFVPHLNVCMIGPDALKNTRTNGKHNDRPNVEIKIKQTLVKQSEGRPYTEYIIEVTKHNETWTIHRKYKAFCELHSALKSALPGVELSEVSYIVNPQEGTKKSLVIEERRKNLEKYLGDLSSNYLVANTLIWKEFIEQPQESLAASTDSPLKQNNQPTHNQQQTPEEFFKVWNERKLRGKQSSLIKKYKAPL